MINPRAALGAGRVRGLVVAFDAASALIVSMLLSFAFVRPAWAYVDPSVMTYTIQALAGVAVALSAVAGVALRRTRRWLLKRLNIDENANKDVEEDAQLLSPAEAAELDSVVPAYTEQAAVHGEQKLGWTSRLGIALLVVLFCGFTLGITAPYEIVTGASGDLMFGLGDVWGIMALFTLAGIVVCTLLLSLLRGRAFTVVVTLAFCFGLCCYVQALALNGGLPPADGRAIEWWEMYGTQMIVTGIVWLAILVVPLFFCLRNVRVTHFALCALSLALVIVQGVGVASLFVNGKGVNAGVSEPEFCTEAGLFDVSPDDNVIVFILDYFDTHTFEEIERQYSDELLDFEGFTWYRNNAGVMIPTGFALPYLLSAQTPAVGQDMDEYLHTRYTSSTFLEELHASGWSIGIYSDTIGAASLTGDECKTEIYENIDNFQPIGDLRISPFGTIKALVKVALYRDMPWALKSHFWFYTDELNGKVVDLPSDSAPEETVYQIDDVRYLDRLQTFGLKADGHGKPGSLRFIHLEGGHFPYSLNERAEFIGLGASDAVTQARGTLHVVKTYLGKLKELGLYESATIMIMSDHGAWEASLGMPTQETEPLLLFKPSHSSVHGMDVSQAPTSHADFHGTTLEAMGMSHDAYPTTYESIAEDDERVRPFYHITHDDSSNVKSLLLYNIEGDVLDFANWHYTGNEWACNYNNDLA